MAPKWLTGIGDKGHATETKPVSPDLEQADWLRETKRKRIADQAGAQPVQPAKPRNASR
jgi:hypothetical protein